VPKKKLTLSVDQAVVEHAKRFARRNATSVSKLVTDFLASLEDKDESATPIVDRLRGILPQTASRDEYRGHLEKKHR